jgi:quercetin 2,3-dioxygenase
MPAVNAENLLVLPRLGVSQPTAQLRPVRTVVSAPRQMEGAGFEVRRPFPGLLHPEHTDPFLLLDHFGPAEYGPGEAKGAPWHPHRGFETVTYMLDGAIQHHDSTGGGGVISGGATQWMTAGSGLLHDELPTEAIMQKGGLLHGMQLWVNLPPELKMTAPRYQDIERDRVNLIASADGGALIRLIAGTLGEHEGPGSTWTPITYAHASVSPGAQLQLDWRPDFNAMVYVLSGNGLVGTERKELHEGQLALFGPGDALLIEADRIQDERSPKLEVLLLGGAPIRQPVVFYGPFVMNTDDEIRQALADYQSGRMGTIPVAKL